MNRNSILFVVLLYNTINHNPCTLYLPNSYSMNPKSNFIPVHFIGEKMKTFFSKLIQNPEYYSIKHYSKIKRKNRNNEIRW